MVEIFSQRSANWVICSMVRPFCKLIWEVQKLSCRAFRTVELLFLDILYMRCAISFGRRPSSQEECQKRALSPFPMVTFVAAAKSSLSLALQGFPSPLHGLELSVHSNQSHLKRSADANLWMLRIPRPPLVFGLQTRSQLTLHFPPETLSHAVVSFLLRRGVTYSCVSKMRSNRC
jgi:hypothetical protein